MSIPIVAVVGRPNVGKSTFFNKVVGRRLSIVEDTPGVTRDRIYAEAEWCGRRFALIDTGGLDPATKDIMLFRIREQAQIAMEMADVIVFIVDGKAGLTSVDEEVSAMLTRTGKPVVLIANKIDSGTIPDNFYDFYGLGLGEPLPISAVNMTGLGDALDRVVEGFPASAEDGTEDEAVRIAVIGKPNVGKSSLVNAITGENRVIVSEVAGTTRDSIDTPFSYAGNAYVLIDTAGIRRKSKVSDDIERYSVIRAIAAVERCDVCILMIDARDGVTEQDKRIGGLAHEAGKGIVIAINKWDLIEKETGTLEAYRKKVYAEFPFMDYALVLFISAKTGQRLTDVLDAATAVSENRSQRVPTGQLNSLIQDAMLMHNPPSEKGKRLKIYYATQVSVRPPLFSFKVNSRDLMHFSYARYLENRIRERFGFVGTSVKFVFREKGET
ncbi:MAG: ribosome biogenesis GTPase Der [Clostridiales Family XIII bacterium]|jgi:GTP-binding protein|nr:ribosome biogenesis GTPase Der [Clostridiales Family XIII bacterium]